VNTFPNRLAQLYAENVYLGPDVLLACDSGCAGKAVLGLGILEGKRLHMQLPMSRTP
jgi:hypothetical protein